MPRRPSQKALFALSWINKKAKELRLSHPDKKWKNLISEAAVLYRQQKALGVF